MASAAGDSKEKEPSVPVSELDRLAGGLDTPAFLSVDGLHAGYGRMQVVHDLSLRVGKGRSLCLIGPNGAGKSTVLHAIYGLARVFSGTVLLGGADITALPPEEKLKTARLGYVLQKDSVFPDMTVEENLLMGGYLLKTANAAKQAAERVLDRYPRLKARRRDKARVLSGGERRLLEISRALIMDPDVLLVDEPSIGLEPRAIDMIFDTLRELRDTGGKTLVLVEQNARKGLEFADVGYVLVAGRLVKAAQGKELLDDPSVGRLFLGG
jgi:branched-chain amino acid transport system ATP-binding protein